MTDQEFRRLSRRDLVDIIYELQKQLAASQAQQEQLREALNRREARLMEAGSIAEAALGLHEVFVHAQAAADQYVQDVTLAHSRAQEEADRIVGEAQQKAQLILAKVRTDCEVMIDQAKAQREAVLAEARATMAEAQAEQDAFSRWMNL